MKNSKELLQKYSGFLEKPSKTWMIVVGILGIFLLIGFYAFVQQMIHGQVVTGQRDYVMEGIYIVNFLFLLGVSYAGAIISGVFHLGRINWGKPLIRIIEIFTFITILIGPIYILLCLGRLERVYYIFIHARIQSPIVWDLIAIMLDLILCTVYLYLTFIKDFALIYDNADELKIAPWRKKLMKVLSIGYKGTDNQKKRLETAQDIMASLIIVVAVVANSLLAWLFGMNLRVGWNSSLLGPWFVVASILSGIAIIIVIMFITRRFFDSKDIITDDHFNYMGFGMGLLALVFGYFSFSDFITRNYNESLQNEKLFDLYTSLDGYLVMLLITFATTILIPIAIVAVPKWRTIKNYVISAVLVLIGLWLFRYLIMIPVMETPFYAITTTAPEVIKYSATWVEWTLSLAGLTGGIFLFMLIAKFVPVFPLAEMDEKHSFKLLGKYKIEESSSEK